MMQNLDAAELRERIRERLALAEVMGHDGVVLRRDGPNKHKCVCPFHTEKSGSFVVGGKYPDRGHCFGCGWDGDIFAYWQAARGVDFKQALEDLAGLAGLRYEGFVYERPAARPQRTAPKVKPSAEEERPEIPPLRQLRKEECVQLAQVRGLSVEAVRCAAFQYRRVAGCVWPLYLGHGGEWLPRSQGTWPSWVVTDDARCTAEFRRLDNEKYPRMQGEEIKAWSTAGKNWPLGVGQIGHRINVLLVEGGPDMLAAYHFLLRWGMVDAVAVVCMLGASNSIRESARGAFAGKRVRIMQDADLPRDDANPRKRKMPGAEAAARWTAELTAAGAAVETFCVGPVYDAADVRAWGAGKLSAAEITVEHPGLLLPDGSAVKDVNDLARCAPEVRDSQEVAEAFCAWDFGG